MALNREGWVVWYYELGDPSRDGAPFQISVFDFLSSHEVGGLLLVVAWGRAPRVETEGRATSPRYGEGRRLCAAARRHNGCS